jgi:glycosyltransferase involved in cell wall biosynthesis
LTEVQAAAVGHSDVKIIPYIDRDMLRRRLGSYEGLLVPSLWAEGLPTVLLEALAAGTPAIVSRSVAAGEQLARYSAAVIYDPRLGEQEISRALKAVRVGGDAMCARARQVHCDSYSRQAWLSAMTGVYERIAS